MTHSLANAERESRKMTTKTKCRSKNKKKLSLRLPKTQILSPKSNCMIHYLSLQILGAHQSRRMSM